MRRLPRSCTHPRPHPKMLVDLDAGASGVEKVLHRSPQWRQNEMYWRAVCFTRESERFFPDSDMMPVMWRPSCSYENLQAVGYLMLDHTGVFGRGAIVGACAFQWREWTDGTPHSWALWWAWVAPKARRMGVMARRWADFRRAHGNFFIDQPVSTAMRAFLAKHDPEAHARLRPEPAH